MHGMCGYFAALIANTAPSVGRRRPIGRHPEMKADNVFPLTGAADGARLALRESGRYSSPSRGACRRLRLHFHSEGERNQAGDRSERHLGRFKCLPPALTQGHLPAKSSRYTIDT